ncbi:hypothetical protein CLV41_12232 [Roseibium marinum]|uniref:Uncharacterized protein n=1 Tax=Roseibium marinum TaxID=281252 RepID=A0A2S3UJ65_9HYPH|nr:hypothetical protein CLV41_12232 [Roseibium marinum]
MRSFGPEKLSLDRMEFVQKEIAARSQKLAHYGEETCNILMIVENSKLKDKNVKVAVFNMIIRLHDIAKQVIDRNIGGRSEVERIAPVLFREIGNCHLCTLPRERNRDSAMRALDVANAFARDICEVRGETAENAFRFSDDSCCLNLGTPESGYPCIEPLSVPSALVCFGHLVGLVRFHQRILLPTSLHAQ